MTRKITPKGTKEHAGPSAPALPEVDVTEITIIGRTEQITVRPRLTIPKRTMEGASSLTFTIGDPQLKLLNAPVLQGKNKTKLNPRGEFDAEIVIDDLVWALTGVALLANHAVELVFEEDAVKALRNTAPLTMSRGKVTRAQFIKRLFDDAGVPLVCPEIDDKQQIETPKEAETEAQKNRKRKPGLASHAKLTVKTHPADREQRENIETALGRAAAKHSGELAAEALLVAIIQEAEARNDPNGDKPSKGILQLLASTAAGLNVDPMNIPAVCDLFLTTGFYNKGGAIALAKEHPDWTPGQVAQAVQGSEFPLAYDVWKEEAKKMVDAYTGGDHEGLEVETITVAKQYQFERKKGETSWKCARRLAEEVDWYLFIEGGVGYFFSGRYLRRSRPMMLVAPGADGIDGVTGSAMTSPTYDDTMTVKCKAKRWAAPPGSIAEVEGYGPYDDRWVVSDIERPKGMNSQATVVTLATIKLPKLEPAHETETRTRSTTGGSLKPDQKIVAKLQREHPELKEGVRDIVAIILTNFALTITSTTSGTHASHSLHYEGRAADLAGPNMDAIGTWIAENLGPKLTEGIHNPTLSVKNGQTVGASYWGATVWAEHRNHIHVGV